MTTINKRGRKNSESRATGGEKKADALRVISKHIILWVRVCPLLFAAHAGCSGVSSGTSKAEHSEKGRRGRCRKRVGNDHDVLMFVVLTLHVAERSGKENWEQRPPK